MRIIFLCSLVAAVYCSEGGNDTSTTHRVTHKAWLNISIANEPIGRIEIGLFAKVVPMTVTNFINLALKPKKQGYKGSKFHYISKEIIMGGDWSTGNGQGGMSSYDNPRFDTENHKIKHYGAGWVSSSPYGEDGHTSLFAISLKKTPNLDTANVVFGKIIKGMDVVRKIAKVPTKSGRPSENVIISDCGAQYADPPFFVLRNDATD